MIKEKLSRSRELELMRAMFKMSLLVDLFDDIALSNNTLIRQKDKQVVKQFQNHFKKKFVTTTEGLYDLEIVHNRDILDPMKAKMEAIMDRVLRDELTFDKLK